jgi:four helix bundle protein
VVGGREGPKAMGESFRLATSSFEDLEVYKRVVELHLEINELTLSFPKYEIYELGSQVRRSSNSIAANIAEGWNNKHSNIYLEGINRALGEMRETRHHLQMALRKGHLTKDLADNLLKRYDECGKMLRGLESGRSNDPSSRDEIETDRNSLADPYHLPPTTYLMMPKRLL